MIGMEVERTTLPSPAWHAHQLTIIFEITHWRASWHITRLWCRCTVPIECPWDGGMRAACYAISRGYRYVIQTTLSRDKGH